MQGRLVCTWNPLADALFGHMTWYSYRTLPANDSYHKANFSPKSLQRWQLIVDADWMLNICMVSTLFSEESVKLQSKTATLIFCWDLAFGHILSHILSLLESHFYFRLILLFSLHSILIKCFPCAGYWASSGNIIVNKSPYRSSFNGKSRLVGETDLIQIIYGFKLHLRSQARPFKGVKMWD